MSYYIKATFDEKNYTGKFYKIIECVTEGCEKILNYVHKDGANSFVIQIFSATKFYKTPLIKMAEKNKYNIVEIYNLQVININEDV